MRALFVSLLLLIVLSVFSLYGIPFSLQLNNALPPSDCYIPLNPTMFHHPGLSFSDIDNLGDDQDFSTADPSQEDPVAAPGGHWGAPWDGSSAIGYIDLGQAYDITALYFLQGWGAGTLTMAPGIPTDNNPIVLTHNGISISPVWVEYTQSITNVQYLTFNRSASLKIHEIAICGTPVGGNPTCSHNLLSQITNKTCNDNGTASDSSDDTFNFDLTITRDNGDTTGTWSGTISGQSYNNQNYNQAITIIGSSISNGAVSVSITDNTDSNCSLSFSEPPTATCSNSSPICSYNLLSQVTNKTCSDSGTASDPADDTFSFDLTITRDNGDATGTWSGTIGGQSYNNQNYNQAITIIGSSISSGAVSVSITDNTDSNCNLSFSEPPTTTCSNDTTQTNSTYIPINASMFYQDITNSNPNISMGLLGDNQIDFVNADPASGDQATNIGGSWREPWDVSEGYVDLGDFYNISAVYFLQGWDSGTMTIAPGIPSDNNSPVITYDGTGTPQYWTGQDKSIPNVRYLTIKRTGGIKIHEIAIRGVLTNSEPDEVVNNNSCGEAKNIICNDIEIRANNLNGTVGSQADCGGFQTSQSQTAWYAFPGINGSYSISTCDPYTNFDTQIAVYSGSCSNLVCEQGVDVIGPCDSLTFNTVLGQTYYVAVGGADGEQGRFNLSIVRNFNTTDCNIYCISANLFSDCDNQGTEDDSDDTFTADIRVRFTNLPTSGTLNISGPQMVQPQSIPISQVDNFEEHKFIGVEFFTETEIQIPLVVTASFSADINCTLTNNDVGFAEERGFGFARPQCSVCDPGFDGEDLSPYPSCWPDENITDECTQAVNFAPDVDFPEHTPERYVKVVLHIFQLEDPNNLGSWQVHPTDPCNFSDEHIDLIRTWFDDSLGINAALSKELCDDPNDFSPHMKDSRIRFLNSGIIASDTVPPGEADVFFHPDNRAWGAGNDGCSLSLGTQSNYFIAERYVDNPDPSHPFFDHLDHDNVRNAFHVLITRGTWRVRDSSGLRTPNATDIPRVEDCYYFGPRGITADMGSCSNSPAQGAFGWYSQWLYNNNEPSCLEIAPGVPVEGTIEVADFPRSDIEIGRGLIGEALHVLSVDHLSPLQAHRSHEDDDNCDDTPLTSSLNRLDCVDFENRCALTQCQIGRMHHYLYEDRPGFERFPDGNGGFTDTLNRCDITLSDIVVPDGADIVWRGPRLMRSNIIIQSGGKLTINCELGLPKDAKIIVESGGRLIVDGARIYNSCDNGFWGGIEVLGTDQVQIPPVPNGQGYVQIKPGSTIERAKFPIQAYKGALVVAENTLFSDCGTLTLRDYDQNSISRFTDCDFNRSAEFFDDIEPANQIQIRLLSVKGIDINRCTFQAANSPQQSRNNSAIVGFASFFKVENSTINGYVSGIRGTIWQTVANTGSFTVKRCTLTNNKVGISSNYNNNITIQDNVINGIGNYNNPGFHQGVVLNNCTGYTVAGNQFEGIGSSNTNLIGVWALNTGSESNVIQENEYGGLYVANQAEEDNRGSFENEGLQYFCNDNVAANNFDFLIFDEGISQFQGGEQNGTKNVFSHANPNFGDFNNQSAGAINYFHTNSSNEAPLVGYYFNIQPILTFDGVSCLDSDEEVDKMLTTQEEQIIIQNFNLAKNTRTTLLNSYSALLNGGDTETSWITQIMGATSSDVATLKRKMLNASPYLNTKVLETVLERDDIFNSTDLSDVLIANPDELRAPKFQALLYTKMSTSTVDNILSYQSQITSRTTTEAELTDYKRVMHKSANRILKSELADTTGLDLIKYRLWLSNKESLESEYELVDTYIAENDYVNARQIRDSIPTKFSLTGETLTEFNHYSTLSEIAIVQKQNNTPYDSFDINTVLQIQGIADNSIGMAGTMARELLNLFYEYNYELTPKALTGGSALIQGNISNIIASQTSIARQPLQIIPNPAKSLVNFYYDLGEDIRQGTIQIFNVEGKLIKSIDLDSSTGNLSWDTDSQDTGVYYCRVRYANTISPPIKLVLLK